MKNIFFVSFLFVILSGLTINFHHSVYAQDPYFNNTSNKIEQEQDFPSHINFSYRSEPFLILNGTNFIDIAHNKTLSLQHFTIGSWIKTNQSIFLEPAHRANKEGLKEKIAEGKISERHIEICLPIEYKRKHNKKKNIETEQISVLQKKYSRYIYNAKR